MQKEIINVNKEWEKIKNYEKIYIKCKKKRRKEKKD